MSLREINRTAGSAEQKGIFLRYARELVQARGLVSNACSHAEASRAHPNVVEILRSAVAAGTTTDSTWAGPLSQYTAASTAFLESLRSRSVFDAVRLGGAIELPPMVTAAVVASGVTAGDQGEPGGILASKMSINTGRITLKQVSAIVVVSEQVARFGSGETSNLFNIELERGVAAATDSVWLAGLYASVSPTASAGATTANQTTDLKALIGALTIGPGDTVIVAHTPGNLQKLALATDTAGQKAFPGLGIDGGIYAGLQFVATDQLPSGAALALVANGFITVSEPLLLDASRQSLLQLDNSPDSPPSASTANLISLWQQGFYGLRALRSYGSTMARTSSISALSGVSY